MTDIGACAVGTLMFSSDRLRSNARGEKGARVPSMGEAKGTLSEVRSVCRARLLSTDDEMDNDDAERSILERRDFVLL